MAHLIDILLVALVVGGAGLAVVKYFLGLLRTPDGQPAGCSGCKACHSNVADGLNAIAVKKLKLT